MTDMITNVTLDDLHTAIETQIGAQFPDLKTVEFYRDDRRQPTVPACLLELVDFEPDEGGETFTEQLALVATFDARIVMGFRTPDAHREVRRASAALAGFINQQRWGQGGGVGPAEIMTVAPDEFSPELDRYEVWRVTWRQTVHIGDTVWTNDGTIPETVLVSWSPEIGPDNEEDYTEVPGT